MFMGRIADLYGRKRVFLLGVLLWGAFSLGCAFAKSLYRTSACTTSHQLTSLTRRDNDRRSTGTPGYRWRSDYPSCGQSTLYRNLHHVLTSDHHI